MNGSIRLFALVVLTGGGMLFAQTQGTQPEGPATAPAAARPPGYIDPQNPRPTYVSPDTTQGAGPYPAIMATDPGAADFVLYYPADLSSLGTKKMPALLCNGSCAYTGNNFRHFLTRPSGCGRADGPATG